MRDNRDASRSEHDVDAFSTNGPRRFFTETPTFERIRVIDWLPDDPYPRVIEPWPDQPDAVGADDIVEVQLSSDDCSVE